MFRDRLEEVKKIAVESLERNIVTTIEGPFLRAGPYQFASFWTRDFCFASRGLIGLRPEVVANHLGHLIKNQYSEDPTKKTKRGLFFHKKIQNFNFGFIARTVDDRSSAWRVIEGIFRRYAGASEFSKNYRGQLRYEYLGEHQTLALDGNFLVLILASICQQKKMISKDWQPYLEKIWRATDFWADEEGFVLQTKFSDWQDSVQRSGRGLYLQILKWRAQMAAKKMGLSHCGRPLKLDLILKKFSIETDQGLVLRTHDRLDQVSSDGILLLIEGLLEELLEFQKKSNLTQEETAKVKSMKKLCFDLWEGLNSVSPFFYEGMATYPSYSSDQVSHFTKFVGLKEYHGNLRWSWLSALYCKVAFMLGDEARALKSFDLFSQVFLRDQTVAEIYDHQLNIFRSKSVLGNFFSLYQSERPFSWGAGLWLETLLVMTKNQRLDQ